ncbi:MAG: hypothetical protein R3E18_10170 [Sphingomonadaceae bacterium]|nr:hypothetical protein [Sphingomonadaceae bacterium]
MTRLCRMSAGLLAMFAASACSAQPSQSESEFAREMIPRLQAAMPGAEMAPDPEEVLTIRIAKWNDFDDAQINLHRIYGYCLNATPTDCETVKQEFVEKIAYRPPPPEAKDLRVIVRDAQYWDYIRETFAEKGGLPFHRQIGDDLYAILAFDSPETIALAQPDQLAEMGLDEDAAWTRATSQTKAVLPQLPDGKSLSRQAVAYENEEYLASLLVDLDSWEIIARNAGPDLFVTAVSDQFVFVGIMGSGPGLDKFRQTVAEDCKASPRCVSPNIYRFRNGRWVIAD